MYRYQITTQHPLLDQNDLESPETKQGGSCYPCGPESQPTLWSLYLREADWRARGTSPLISKQSLVPVPTSLWGSRLCLSPSPGGSRMVTPSWICEDEEPRDCPVRTQQGLRSPWVCERSIISSVFLPLRWGQGETTSLIKGGAAKSLPASCLGFLSSTFLSTVSQTCLWLL